MTIAQNIINSLNNTKLTELNIIEILSRTKKPDILELVFKYNIPFNDAKNIQDLYLESKNIDIPGELFKLKEILNTYNNINTKTPIDINTNTPFDINTKTPIDINTNTPIDINTETPTDINNCSNEINDITNLINAFTKDLLLDNTNIFTSKPIEYHSPRLNNISDINIPKKLISFISEKIQPSILMDKSYLDDPHLDNGLDNIQTGGELDKEVTIYNQIKIFLGEITDVFSSNLLFSDEKQKIIRNFQYFIIKIGISSISKYKKDKGLHEHSIQFIYKGGTTMKILYTKYINELKLNKKILNNYRDLFKRSDSDYAVYINKMYFHTEVEYNKILRDMHIIVYNMLTQAQDIFSKYSECLCPINNISNKNLEEILQKMNNKLKDPKTQKDIPDLKIIKEFTGITFNDKEYFKEKPIPINIKDIHSFKLDSDDTIQHNKDFMQNGKKPSQRNNFLVKIGPHKKDEDLRYSSHIIKLPKCNKDSIYYTFNETVRIYENKLLREFHLHRLKINTILYYKTNDNKYGFFNCPSELVDISISTYNDHKVAIKPDSAYELIFQKYDYRSQFSYYSYSVYGYIHDMVENLREPHFPWQESKYIKKINRLIIFIFIYINKTFINNPSILVDLTREFQNILFQKNNNNNNNIIDYNKYNNDKIIKYIFQFIFDVKKKVESCLNTKNYISEFNTFINFFIGLKDFKLESELPLEVDSPNGEKINMLQKYLKYKSKYIKLLSKLGHT